MRDLCLILTILSLIFCIEIGCQEDPDKEVCGGQAPQTPCDEDKMVNFLANIQIINPESIVELAVDSLEPLCRNLCGHLDRFDNYLKKCKVQKDEELYMSLIQGVKVLRDKLCTDSDFYRRFQNHYHCLHELRNDFEGCNAPADWNEEADKEELCTDYKNMIDCYYIKAAKVCGYGPASTIKELIKDVVNSIIKVKCSGINSNPYVRDPMPDSYEAQSCEAGTVQIFSKMVMSLNFLFLYANQ